MSIKNKPWIEAMRLRTLPVSIAGVMAGGAVAVANQSFKCIPFIICLLFAVMAQIVSNFANEYFDFKNGLDKKGRDGFRRGVTEGDIPATKMRNATFGLLIATCIVGCSLIYYGGLILIPFGILIAIGALAYSAGPWPLSHHGLGDIAVFLFYGLIPVFFTAYTQIPDINIWPLAIIIGSAIGLMGVNVLIVNNYRDYEDDKAVRKQTTAVILGRRTISNIYFANGIVVCILLAVATASFANIIWELFLLLYANNHFILWKALKQYEGKQLNAVLGKTASMMPIVSLWLMLLFIFN